MSAAESTVEIPASVPNSRVIGERPSAMTKKPHAISATATSPTGPISRDT